MTPLDWGLTAFGVLFTVIVLFRLFSSSAGLPRIRETERPVAPSERKNKPFQRDKAGDVVKIDRRKRVR